MAFQTTTARLLLWRDGIPLTAEPLLPLAPFGAHAPALATIAADLSALSGIDPARAVLLVFVAAIAALLVGLFALEATWLPPAAAALGALSGLAVAQGLDWLALWGSGEAFLCLGLVLPASALVLGHVSRSSAFAAGMLFAAGLVAQPLLAVAVWTTCAVVLLARRSRRALCRLTLVSGATACLGGPGLVPALSALSARELRGDPLALRSRPGCVPRRIRRAAARRPSGATAHPVGKAKALVARRLRRLRRPPRGPRSRPDRGRAAAGRWPGRPAPPGGIHGTSRRGLRLPAASGLDPGAGRPGGGGAGSLDSRRLRG